MTHPKADGVTITCEKCGAFDWRPADGNGGGGGRGCTCPKADGLDALKREYTPHEYEDMSTSEQGYTDGWNDCIDHLAQRGMILQDGWVAVPRELSRNAAAEMEDVYGSDTNIAQWLEWWQEVYKDLLAAAPKMEGKK